MNGNSLALENWDYAHCLPYFKKAETWAFGGDGYRGNDGPLGVNNGNKMANPLYKAFVNAALMQGISPLMITTVANRKVLVPCT